MSRLTEKLQSASSIVQRVSAKIEARADALIEREKDIERKIHDAFSPHEALMDNHHKDLDDVENALRQFSNEPIAVRSTEVAKQ